MAAPEVIISEAIVKQVAASAATGATVGQIAASLALSKYHVKKIMATNDFKTLVRGIGDEAVNNAKQVIRANTSDMAAEVTRVLKERLEDNDLEAVKVALKIIGFDQQEQTKGDTNIVVQLPGQVEQVIESEYHEIESSDN